MSRVRPEKGVVVLSDSDALPASVTITEFKGNRRFYMVFTKVQCMNSLSTYCVEVTKVSPQGQELESGCLPFSSSKSFGVWSLFCNRARWQLMAV
eukprot:5781216-Amphidinium_carterae.1